MRTITFNELRKIKDSLPSGSMHRIADELGLHVDTVRNFFGGHNFKEGKSVGIHLEPGPDGGLVMLDDTTVLDRALKILDELNITDGFYPYKTETHVLSPSTWSGTRAPVL